MKPEEMQTTEEQEPFMISPEDLKSLDKAIEEIDNGYEPQVFDLSKF